MIESDVQVCRTIAIRHGLPLQFVMKEFHVFDVLGQITALEAKRKNFVFKGGTALNSIYLRNLQRFSEDLDFDLDERLPGVLQFCKGLAGKISGYEVSGFRRVRGTVQFYLAYRNALGAKDHVRVDVASKKIITEKPLILGTAVSKYANVSVTGFVVYPLEDLAARKLAALQSRAEGKDVYDVFHALPLCGPLDGALSKMLESEGIKQTPKVFLEKTVLKVKKTNPTQFRNPTNPFIPSAYRPKDWTEFRNELIIRLEKVIASIQD